MYKGTRFSIKDDETIMADIDFAALHCRNQDRLFLCDGDALILPQERLLAILTAVRSQTPLGDSNRYLRQYQEHPHEKPGTAPGTS